MIRFVRRISPALLCALAVVAAVIGLHASDNASASPPQQDDVTAGKQVYQTRCQYCHGEQGKGDGPGAAVMYPRPRDFTTGAFKIRTTDFGEAPTDADLTKIISDGMPGSTMPAWRSVLKDSEIKQVIAYIKTFNPSLFDPKSPPKAVQLSTNAPAASQASIEKGQKLFQEVQCWKCHGQEGRGDGPSAFDLKDKLGNKIFPADLTKPWNFRGGASAPDLYRTVVTGLTGTPMPSFADALKEDERWDLINYVKSLAVSEKKPDVKAVLLARHVDGALPGDASSDAWKQADSFFFPLVGQLVHEPRVFTPTIDSAFAQALYNDKEIAFLISWDERVQHKDSNADDGVALQFPNVIPTALERPYFILGDASHPVNLWQWQASKDKVEEANATGINALAPQKADSQSVQGSVTFKNGRYQMVVKRALSTNDTANDIQFVVGKFIPVALSAWDGGAGEGGARRSVSAWYSLYLEQPTPATAYLSIPIAMAVVVLVEVAALWLLRRGRRSITGPVS